MTAVDPIAQLTGPDGPFEIVVEEVAGHAMHVYKQRMRSLRELMSQNAARADVDWLVQGDRRLTYGEHDRQARVLARSLAQLGVQRGDRVALVSANVPEWVITWWACAILGATLVPLNAWWKADELEFGLSDSESKVLIADARRIALLRDRLGELPALQHVFVIDGPADSTVRAFAELVADPGDPGIPESPIDEDDVLAILYTSGTTGRPKGATVSHRQAVANVQNIIVMGVAQAMRGTPPPEAAAGLQSSSLLVVPLFHVTGCLSTMTLSYATGGKVVLMPVGRFDPDVAMQIIERDKVTSIGGVPTIMWRILESPNLDKYDLTTVKRASYGGAPAAPELVERIERVFPHMRKTLTTAYGLTETASVATAHGGDDYFAHPGSVGRAAPTVELRVVDDRGVDQPAGERGEIWIKGPTVMAHGYWRRPDANASAFTDGWFHTGDIGYLDRDGFLYLVDRAKDMIIRGGENVYCVEIENVLFDHPDVVDAAVVGVPHKELGEEVKAVVQVRPGSTTTAEDLRDFCRARLADFKVPAYVDLSADPLPRNPAGKVLKNLLRGGESAFATSDDQAL
ncbi:MAG TPA: class I adenylate-forming enzyme family protein [Acidimicrobiia bacterium]|nr:class I adenylate-forming enzyme family protein [Acidimicrobiia bacterium]